MSDIPGARERLARLAAELDALEHPKQADEARKIIKILWRSYTRPRTPVKSKSMTPGLAGSIRAMKSVCPDMSNQDLANAFGVNPGRVTEALNGDW